MVGRNLVSRTIRHTPNQFFFYSRKESCVRNHTPPLQLWLYKPGSVRDDNRRTIDDAGRPASPEMAQSGNTAPGAAIPSYHASFFKGTLEWGFPIANLLLELIAEVFNQMSSRRHPHLGLISVLTSLLALLICIVELIYRAYKEKVAWKKNGKIYWLFLPNGLPFGTVIDVVALTCSLLQCVFASIAYAFYHKHAEDPIKVSVWPVIFAFGLLCSKLFNRSNSAIQLEGQIPV